MSQNKVTLVFKVTVQFETEMAKMRFLAIWIDQKESFKIAKNLL